MLDSARNEAGRLLNRPAQPPHAFLDLPHVRSRKTKPERTHVRITRKIRRTRHKRHAQLNRLLGKLARNFGLAARP